MTGDRMLAFYGASGSCREATAEQVMASFARWIKTNDFMQVTVGPPPK